MIDWLRLSALQNAVGNNDFTDLVAQFLAEADEIIPRLTDHDDPESHRHDIEFLKGAASSLGFHALAQSCELNADFCLHRLRATYIQSRHEFLAGIGGVSH